MQIMDKFRSIINTWLITLSLTVLLSACGGGSNSNGSSSPSANSLTLPPNNVVATVMVSTSADLLNPIPLSGASLNGSVYIFFREGSDWADRGITKVIFYCCKSDTDPHVVYPDDSVAPYMINVDLSPLAPGSTRELYADVFFTKNGITTHDEFLVNFTISGTSNGNSPPTINGNPQTVAIEGSTYSFSPAANDNDGDTLTFNIVNKPDWATFDTSTGKLTGTTSAGTTSNIIISVTDGIDTAYLPPFDITVPTLVVGSATLSWIPPTTNEDGSTLTDLTGYKIHYGTSPGSYTSVIPVNLGLTDYTINNLTGPDTYYFVMTAVNSTDTESVFSNEVSKIIQ